MFGQLPSSLSWDGFGDGPVLWQFLATAGIVALWIALRLGTGAVLSRMSSLSRRARRQWMVRVRNTTILLVVAGIIAVWHPQLARVATALALVAAAFAIATKELWLNLTGYLFRSGAHFFTVGDRIEIGDFHGDVIDHGPMGATVLEIGAKSHQHTGRAVFVPNSKFLTTPVINATFFHGFVFHTLTIPMKASSDWAAAEQALLQAADEVCRPYLDRVAARMQDLTARNSLDTPATEPRVHIHLPEPDKIHLVLRVPVEARRKGRTEQRIIRRYLELTAPLADPETAPDVPEGTHAAESQSSADAPG